MDIAYEFVKDRSTLGHSPLEFIKISNNYYILDNIIHSFSDENLYENFKRIDVIFSKNLDRIFIGIVKYDMTYLNKGIYQKDEIDVFRMQSEDKMNKINFQISLKNGEVITLCTFTNTQITELYDFIVLLNWKIDKLTRELENIILYSK